MNIAREKIAAARALDNPYWDAVLALRGGVRRYDPADPATLLGAALDIVQERRARDELVVQYAWAIPDPHALAFVACALGPYAVEMGAGTGYWASLLAQLGVDICAYDSAPPDRVGNIFHSPRTAQGYPTGKTRPTYYLVERGKPDVLSTLPADRALFLCWPPYNEPMAAEALAAFQGNRVVYIGEGDGGCTGDDAFHEALERDWEAVASGRVQQWDGIHDWAYVYDRAKKEQAG